MLRCILLLSLLTYPSTVLGQINIRCAFTDFVEQDLSIIYGEKLAATGLTSGSWIIERWESESGTWTLVVRPDRNLACVLTHGDNWRELLKPVPNLTPTGEDHD